MVQMINAVPGMLCRHRVRTIMDAVYLLLLFALYAVTHGTVIAMRRLGAMP